MCLTGIAGGFECVYGLVLPTTTPITTHTWFTYICLCVGADDFYEETSREDKGMLSNFSSGLWSVASRSILAVNKLSKDVRASPTMFNNNGKDREHQESNADVDSGEGYYRDDAISAATPTAMKKIVSFSDIPQVHGKWTLCHRNVYIVTCI